MPFNSLIAVIVPAPSYAVKPLAFFWPLFGPLPGLLFSFTWAGLLLSRLVWVLSEAVSGAWPAS